MKKIYSITKACYKQFAEQIISKMDGQHYLSGIFSVVDGQVVHRLELSIIIYREAGSGEVAAISDVWWDSYTIERGEDSEPRLKVNDFDFALLYKQLMGE